jgi:hypothetical protein
MSKRSRVLLIEGAQFVLGIIMVVMLFYLGMCAL